MHLDAGTQTLEQPEPCFVKLRSQTKERRLRLREFHATNVSGMSGRLLRKVETGRYQQRVDPSPKSTTEMLSVSAVQFLLRKMNSF